MKISVLKSKIHNVKLSECRLDYEGSIEIDSSIMENAGLFPYEKVLVVNRSNGERLETYVIPGARGSGIFMLNGAAARRGAPGDTVTIMSFASCDLDEAAAFKPTILIMHKDGKLRKKKL